ncbi:hypothetical protein E2320_000042, partial [Naja naja]
MDLTLEEMMREARRMRAVLCCREKGFGVVKKAGEPSSVLGWGVCGCDVLGGLTQEKLQLFVSLGKEEESDRSQDQLPRNPEEKMETISWMTGLGLVSSSTSHLSPTLLLPEEMVTLSPRQHLIFYSRSEKKKKMVGMKVLHSLGSCLLLVIPPSFLLSFSPFVDPPESRLGLLQPLKEGEGPMKPEAQREIQKEKGPSLWITLKILLFTSLVSLRWTFLETSSPSNIKWRRGFESGSPEGSHRIRFFFICKNESYLTIQDHHLSNNTFNVRTENVSSDQIICTCKFMFRKFRETSWGQPYSPESNQLVFSVVGVPPSPLLKVDPLTQKVKKGDPLVFLCSMEGGDREKKFHFYKDGVEITSSKEGLLEPSTEPSDPLQNASLRIPHASFNHRGEFACNYEEKRSNRWIMSSLSQGTNITVEPASVSQEQFQLREKKEERNDLPVMEPQAPTEATSSPVK